jgi:hypothetical protein
MPLLNLTIASLSIQGRLNLSPFFKLARTTLPRSVLFSSLDFRNWSESFVKSLFPGSFRFFNCRFQRFLSTPLMFESGGSNVGLQSRTIRQNTEYYERNVTIEKCHFLKCTGDKGGGFSSWRANVTIFDTVFEENKARVAGAAHILNSDYLFISRMLVTRNTAEYSGGFAGDTDLEGNFSDIDTINITFNHAEKWTGGFRMDHSGGNLVRGYFEGNSAAVCGAFFDFTWAPARRHITQCVFKNNTSVARGGAYTAFHILHGSLFTNDVFVQNRCERSAYSISVESIDATVEVRDCTFDGPENEQISLRFPGESNLSVNGCDFELGGERLESVFGKLAVPIRDRFGELRAGDGDI